MSAYVINTDAMRLLGRFQDIESAEAYASNGDYPYTIVTDEEDVASLFRLKELTEMWNALNPDDLKEEFTDKAQAVGKVWQAMERHDFTAEAEQAAPRAPRTRANSAATIVLNRFVELGETPFVVKDEVENLGLTEAQIRGAGDALRKRGHLILRGEERGSFIYKGQQEGPYVPPKPERKPEPVEQAVPEEPSAAAEAVSPKRGGKRKGKKSEEQAAAEAQ